MKFLHRVTSDPEPGGHEGLKGHRRNQQGRGGTDLPGCRFRPRRRPVPGRAGTDREALKPSVAFRATNCTNLDKLLLKGPPLAGLLRCPSAGKARQYDAGQNHPHRQQKAQRRHLAQKQHAARNSEDRNRDLRHRRPCRPQTRKDRVPQRIT